MIGPSGRSLLAQVREGMTVYDAANQKIGTVKNVFMGGVDQANAERQLADANRGTVAGTDPGGSGYEETFGGNLLGAFSGGGGGLPDAVRRRLEHEGFIEIDASGLFASDRYATKNQIAEVAGDQVILSVSDDELAQG